MSPSWPLPAAASRSPPESAPSGRASSTPPGRAASGTARNWSPPQVRPRQMQQLPAPAHRDKLSANHADSEPSPSSSSSPAPSSDPGMAGAARRRPDRRPARWSRGTSGRRKRPAKRPGA
eukprot:2493996-Alexandrium_andersonii.AAC.1